MPQKRQSEAKTEHGTGTQKTYGVFIGLRFWHIGAKHRAISTLKNTLAYDTQNTTGEVREMLRTTYNRLQQEAEHANATNARNVPATISAQTFRENSTRIY